MFYADARLTALKRIFPGFLRAAADSLLPPNYKFCFAQALMRSSAFSMFSIELATLKRK